MTGVDEARKVWCPGSRTPTQHMLRQLMSVWQVMVQVLTRHRGERGGGGRGRRAGCEIIE